MRKLLGSIFLMAALTCFIGCKTADMQYGSVNIAQAQQTYKDTMTYQMVDSMISADTLPAIAKWTVTRLTDSEDGTNYTYYTLYDNESGVIYTIKKLTSNSFVVMKRTVKAR